MKNQNPGSNKPKDDPDADPVRDDPNADPVPTQTGADPVKSARHFSMEELVNLAAPKPTPEQDFSVRMRERLEEKKRKSAERQQQERNEKALYFLECDRCTMPALFFTRHPGTDVLGSLDWFSELKPLGRQWIGGKIACQSCNSKARALYIPGGKDFVPDARFIRSIDPKEDGVKEVIEACAKMRESLKAVKA